MQRRGQADQRVQHQHFHSIVLQVVLLLSSQHNNVVVKITIGISIICLKCVL